MCSCVSRHPDNYFNPRTSCEVRPEHGGRAGRKIWISIHAPLARCDPHLQHGPACYQNFNPRTSCEVRHILRHKVNAKHIFQSTHLLRGATDYTFQPQRNFQFQSTHLLRGATGYAWAKVFFDKHFNPRTSCEVRRRMRSFPAAGWYFNPRTSCEVRLLRS